VRVLAYQAAIARHSRGCSVVEIGCGSGILSIFAARAQIALFAADGVEQRLQGAALGALLSGSRELASDGSPQTTPALLLRDFRWLAFGTAA